jgi:beta-lactamase class A
MRVFSKLSRQLEEWKSRVPGTWGVWVEDLETAESWTWNETRPFYAASLIKVPIMVAVYREMAKERLRLGEELVLQPEDQVGGSGVLQHLSPGLRIPIRDLVTLMIIQSDNTATNMLIDRIGKEAIRETMAELGMKNSLFYNPLMIIPADREGVNAVTAEDMASCYRKIARGEAVSWHACRQMIRILKRQQFRDCFPSSLPPAENDVPIGSLPAWELAHKTGMVNRVLHDTGILYVGDHAVLLIALSEGLEYREAAKLLGELARLVYDSCRQ